MEKAAGHVLIVDDDRQMCEMLEVDFRHRGLSCRWTTQAHQVQECIKQEEFDVLLTDIRMPGMDGLQLCQQIAAQRPDMPIIVLTAFGSLETAVAAMRAGAYDFVTKPVELDLLALQVERALKHRTLQKRIKLLHEEIERRKYSHELVGESQEMQELYNRLDLLSHSEASVLLVGESGTGKERVARLIHQHSKRNQHPFVAINCASLPDSLLESEMFGHVKGAFTGAQQSHKGLFEQANLGTLFLDEIGEMPLSVQAKLLRVLEDNRVRPVGAETEITLDVRVIAATHQDLETAVEEGRFREDLFFRLNVIQLEIPPLRTRGNDILLLAQHFLQRFAQSSQKEVLQLSESVVERLLSYPWPGNVRELRNALEHAVVLTRHQTLVLEDLPKKIRTYEALSMPMFLQQENPGTAFVSLEEMERQYILYVLQKLGGNRTLAAKLLNVDRKTLYRKLQKYFQWAEP